jgi:hypothetical protein
MLTCTTTSFTYTMLNSSLFRFVNGVIHLSNVKFVSLNLFFFLKNIQTIVNILYAHLIKNLNFFVFSFYNITAGFFSIIQYICQSVSVGDYNILFSFTKKNLNYYYSHSLINELGAKYNVCCLVITDMCYPRYNLYALRNTQFILIGVSTIFQILLYYDFFLFVKTQS